MDQIEQPSIHREKTAIVRFRHSKPVTLALLQGVITTETSVFDYGCGRGEDVKYLKSVGVEAAGWDPHYQPTVAPKPADVVNLGYVLNVIEDPRERKETLRKAFDLASRVLVVAVRVDHSLETAVEFSDGLLTSRGSFQKLYSQIEFRDYVAQVLGRRPHMAGLGVAYIFRDELVESSYLVSLAQKRVETSREQVIDHFAQDAAARKYIELTAALGRAPIPTEFDGFPDLQERFGSLVRIERLARHALSMQAIEESRQRRREDILTYMAMARLRNLKEIPFRLLPQDLRADIKTLWPSYSAALREGESFLFRIGNPELVRDACQTAPVGKKFPDALYVHRSAEEQLGALLRLVIFAARQVVGELEYNVVKIATDGRKLSFLQYDNFDEQAHPELRHSVRVFLPRASYSVRDYSASLNPPILHRKETLVDVLYPHHAVFSELSAQEAARGLLARSDIGTKQTWLALLAETKLTIIGHQLVPTSDA